MNDNLLMIKEFHIFIKKVKELKTADNQYSVSKHYINQCVNQVQERLYKKNQFFLLNNEEELAIKTVCKHLLCNQSLEKEMIKKSFVLIRQLLDSKNKWDIKTTQSEYTPKLQLRMLGISIEKIIQPVLDIGCGKKRALLDFFIQKGIEAWGLDLFVKGDNAASSNWLDFYYGVNKWGVIIAHQSFSNHYSFHYQQNSKDLPLYINCFQKILLSLKKGGIFLLVPGLNMLDKIIDNRSFEIIHTNIQFPKDSLIPEKIKNNFYRTCIRKIQ